jgi:hypothetical protein
MTMYRLTTAVILLALSGCIAQLTVAEKAPHASYDVGDVIAISVVDERYKLRYFRATVFASPVRAARP